MLLRRILITAAILAVVLMIVLPLLSSLGEVRDTALLCTKPEGSQTFTRGRISFEIVDKSGDVVEIGLLAFGPDTLYVIKTNDDAAPSAGHDLNGGQLGLFLVSYDGEPVGGINWQRCPGTGDIFAGIANSENTHGLSLRFR